MLSQLDARVDFRPRIIMDHLKLSYSGDLMQSAESTGDRAYHGTVSDVGSSCAAEGSPWIKNNALT